MRPTSFVRTSTPRSPARLRTTSHAPMFKAKQPTATVEKLPAQSVSKTPSLHKPANGQQAA
ncbi:hypothetical protein C9I98_24035 [Photobacterium sanctipauli]|uniref:Uncharacterized protein n=1 Tax=Photobacterium sanctipauli TaxID=1342794 RepID=A0A2T3NCG0_9GAMM|nr:hypothetical protein [Photobacterium sanctipauli]PSW11713.1 hypothetical protein C9I98_24035 [Photobacterium sanctipauli]